MPASATVSGDEHRADVEAIDAIETGAAVRVREAVGRRGESDRRRLSLRRRNDQESGKSHGENCSANHAVEPIPHDSRSLWLRELERSRSLPGGPAPTPSMGPCERRRPRPGDPHAGRRCADAVGRATGRAVGGGARHGVRPSRRVGALARCGGGGGDRRLRHAARPSRPRAQCLDELPGGSGQRPRRRRQRLRRRRARRRPDQPRPQAGPARRQRARHARRRDHRGRRERPRRRRGRPAGADHDRQGPRRPRRRHHGGASRRGSATPPRTERGSST